LKKDIAMPVTKGWAINRGLNNIIPFETEWSDVKRVHLIAATARLQFCIRTDGFLYRTAPRQVAQQHLSPTVICIYNYTYIRSPNNFKYFFRLFFSCMPAIHYKKGEIIRAGPYIG
jgi:hypothetical protein